MVKRQRQLKIILLCGAVPPHCWAFPCSSFRQHPSRTRRRTPPPPLWAATEPQEQDGGGDVNGGGGLVTQQDARSQLFSAFASLDLSDQYDAVLCSACAKILDAAPGSLSEPDTRTKLADCQQLLQEMNDSQVAASPRSTMALVDSTVKTQDAQIMASVMSQCLRNPIGIAQYGAQQADLILLPSSPTSKVKCPDGKFKTARDRLASVPAVPVDDRAAEVTAALLFAVTVVACETTNLLGATDAQPAANLLLAALVGVVAIDNFYDILKNGSQFLVNQIGKKGGDPQTIINLPEKDQLPAGLGSGAATGRVVRGLTRLWTVDTERESACEAAALYAAYVLGLPCFAFRPNALEGSLLVQESVESSSSTGSENSKNAPPLDSLLTDAGLLRMLVWLLAPVAMESASHAQLLMSDPREAGAFLTRLEEQFGPDDDRLAWNHSAFSKNDLLKWAYAEADCLLRDNKAAVQEIANRLSGGAATVGDCVAVIENW